MADKAWKSCERRIASYLGGERVPVTGRQRGSAPDIDHAWLSIEVKYRKTLPAWIKDALSQAKASAQINQMPVVILCEKGQETGKTWVLCELGEFTERFVR